MLLVILIMIIGTVNTNDLVSNWNVDEGTGTAAADISGCVNDANLVNGPIWIDGKIGKALQFDGSDDHVLEVVKSLNNVCNITDWGFSFFNFVSIFCLKLREIYINRS
jgi:hypothetical protein